MQHDRVSKALLLFLPLLFLLLLELIFQAPLCLSPTFFYLLFRLLLVLLVLFISLFLGLLVMRCCCIEVGLQKRNGLGRGHGLANGLGGKSGGSVYVGGYASLLGVPWRVHPTANTWLRHREIHTPACLSG